MSRPSRRSPSRIAKAAKPLTGVEILERERATPHTYVVVVGESLSKYHMHLYGYERDTTPELDRLSQSGAMTVFRDVVTSHAMTVPALTNAFSFDRASGHDGHTLFDVLNGAGFKTFWLSNQYQYGFYQSGVSLLTSAATQFWASQPLGNDNFSSARRDFDTDLLPELRRVIAGEGQDKFIFLHLMGSHYLYKTRYPSAEDYFNPTELPRCLTAAQAADVNDYDNSVRFNDSLIQKIVEVVRDAADAAGDAFVLYFSDHGEEIFEYRDFEGHTDTMLSPYLAEIPFVVWLSRGYRQHHPEIAARVGAAQNRSYDTSDLLYSITDLARLSFPGDDPTRSIFSGSFVPRQRMTADRDYDQFKRGWTPDAAHAKPAPLIRCSPYMNSANAR